MQGRQGDKGGVDEESVEMLTNLYKAKLKEISERKGLDSRSKTSALLR